MAIAKRSRHAVPILTSTQQRKLNTWAYSRVLLERERARHKRRMDAISDQLKELGEAKHVAAAWGISAEHVASHLGIVREQMVIPGREDSK